MLEPFGLQARNGVGVRFSGVGCRSSCNTIDDGSLSSTVHVRSLDRVVRVARLLVVRGVAFRLGLVPVRRGMALAGLLPSAALRQAAERLRPLRGRTEAPRVLRLGGLRREPRLGRIL